ncbi:MAG: phage portal protein [Xanthobacteraceae bacterium]
MIEASSYIFTDPDTGAKRTFDRQDIIHLRARSLDGVSGISPTQSCREAIGLSLVMERYAGKLFGNSARPSGVLSFKENLTDKALANVRAIWNATHGGDKSGGTAILEGCAEWKPITLTSTDAQFLELRQFQILEIARAFRVPPTWLMQYDRATRSNAAEMRRHFLDFCIAPWLKKWEGEIR